MLKTTYQHDYIRPNTKRYDFMLATQAQKNAEEKVECQCVEPMTIEVPLKAQEQCAAEWTGIAPMGRLVDPRIIPTKFSPETMEAMKSDVDNDCFKMQPNRFLKILRTAYPDLYERLKLMNKDEINRRVDRERLFTTYQIDYCNVIEYPEGVYESLKQEEETSKINATKMLKRKGPCDEFRENIMHELEMGTAERFATTDPCDRVFKPFKIAFTDSSRFIQSGNNSHWRSGDFQKRANFTEYKDTISRVGCIIMKNDIHNHSKCLSGKHCRHKLQQTCNTINF